ncbi:MAG: hypothetical protein ACYC1Y_02520 [Minisyncoccota bacterium]
MKKLLPVILLALFVAAGGLYYFTHVQKQSVTQTDTSAWKTYVNTSYGYEVKYPADMTVGYLGMAETIPIEESGEAIIHATGKPDTFGINAYTPLTDHRTDAVKKQADLIALPLQQFAETIRQDQVNDKNSWTPDKQVGELKKINFAGREAYSFTLTRSFHGTGRIGDYLLDSDGAVYNFVFVENNAEVKLMIRYPLGDTTAEQIKNSFEFIAR